MLICCFIVLWKPWYCSWHKQSGSWDVLYSTDCPVWICWIYETKFEHTALSRELCDNMTIRPLRRLLYLWSGRLWWGPGELVLQVSLYVEVFGSAGHWYQQIRRTLVSSVQSSAGTNSHRTCPTTPEHTKHTTEALLWVHIHNSGSSAVNGCRQNESPNSW